MTHQTASCDDHSHRRCAHAHADGRGRALRGGRSWRRPVGEVDR